MRAGKSLFLFGLLGVAAAAPAPVPMETEPASPTVPTAPTDVPADPTQAINELEALASAMAEHLQTELEGTNETETEGAARRAISLWGSGCTLSKLKIRREWSTLSRTQKKNYISAVQCLQSKPARTPAEKAPGAKTRFDDFVALHINQTMEIHYTGNFLSWHRYFTWLYEEALQKECGYTGTQPYWNWGFSALTGLENYPVFDGSDTSLSGNGEFIPDKEDIFINAGDLPPIRLAAGTGGGCVTSGPFKDYKVNLGPVNLDTPGGVIVSNPNGPFAYNPRCLKRDLSTHINRAFSNGSAVLANVIFPQNINDFQMQMQGIPGSGNIGIHGGGHYSMGGDPGRDFFVSPSDPAFYLHHAMIDRVWWLWQELSPNTRTKGASAIAGTRTFMNMPPSDPATIEDILDMGYAGGPARPIKDTLSTTGGPFCYIYL